MLRLVSLLLLIAQPVLAGNLFVSDKGSPTPTGSPYSPFATIQEALAHATPGTTIRVEGEHAGPIRVDRSGTKDAPIFIVGGKITGDTGIVVDAHDVVLRAIEFAHLKSPDSVGLRITNESTRIAVYQCSFEHFVKSQVGIVLEGHGKRPLTDILVSNCSFSGSGQYEGVGLLVEGNTRSFRIAKNRFFRLATAKAVELRGKGMLPTDGLIEENQFMFSAFGKFQGRASTGVTINGASQIQIRKNTMISSGRGIEIVGNKQYRTAHILIEKNNIRKNDFGGILIDGTAGLVSDCTIRLNKILDNDYGPNPDVPVRILGGEKTRFLQNFVEVDNPIPLVEFNVEKGNLISNFNDFHSAKGALETKFIFDGKEIVGLAKYQSESGLDSKSKFVARGRDSSGSQSFF